MTNRTALRRRGSDTGIGAVRPVVAHGKALSG
jgi:hypothetical protein